MDYKKFFDEISDWILMVNQKASEHGMQSDAFWDWVMQSSGEFGVRYKNNDLVVRQMLMLLDWLELVHKKTMEG